MDAFIAYLREGGGRQTEIARACGVTNRMVWMWAHRRRPVAAHHCLKIEYATNGQFRAADLRPDVFCPPKIAA